MGQSLRAVSRRRRFGLSLALAAALILQPGCTYVASTSLQYSPAGPTPAAPAPLKLAVVPFKEQRKERFYPSATGRMFLTYIPLIPYVSIPYERLDESLAVAKTERGEIPDPEGHFTIAMARMVADDLRQSNYFRDVVFVEDPKDTGDADLILAGVLESTEFRLNATSYMLGMAGVLLWLLPIPLGSNTAEVSADLWLQEPDGDIVWRDKLKGQGRKIFTFYNSAGAPVSNRFSLEIKRYGENDKGIDGDSLWAYHAEALRAAMRDAKPALAAYVAERSRLGRE